MNYQSLIYIHTLIGVSALITFWIAALSKKGSLPHRRAGKAYIGCMVIILVSVIPMIIVQLQQRNITMAVVLTYLFAITAVATYTTWSAILNKKTKEKYHSLLFKITATIVFLFGCAILIIAILNTSFIQFIFSTVGIVLGWSMWRNVWVASENKKWYLAQHMNGVAVNFAATHGSFLRFGLVGILPIADSPEINTLTQTSMIVLALILRLWLGRKFLKTTPHPEPAESLT